MDNVESFIQKFGGLTESYAFYDGTIELRFDTVKHVYLLVQSDGTLKEVDGVTSTCHIIDKSVVLLPWACKMMQQKLLNSLIPYLADENPEYVIKVVELEDLIAKAKTAHKEKLEDAGEVGKYAHAWIEEYIKAKLDEDHIKYEQLTKDFPTDDRAQNACIATLDWIHRHNVRFIATERKVYSRKFQYAGTMDGLAKVDSCNNPLCCPTAFKDHLAIVDWKTSNYLFPEFIMQTASYEAAYEEEIGTDVQDRFIVRLGKDDAKFEVWHLTDETFKQDFETFLAALLLKREFAALEARLEILKDIYKQGKKQEKKDALLKKCKKADKYTGKRKSTCNTGGTQCESCKKKHEEYLANKPVKVKKTKKVKLTDHEVIKSLQDLLKSA